MPTDTQITSMEVSGWEIPTDQPESDGTLEWDSTTIIVVEVSAGTETGVGWTYTDRSAAALIEGTLRQLIVGGDALSPPAIWEAMLHRLRNTGKPGIASMAVSAVDMAVWDLKARLLDVTLADLLGRRRATIPLYGSGGFTSYDLDRLRNQLAGWVDDGMSWVKMKVGREPDEDPSRVRAARVAIGDEAGLMVDANGAYERRQALEMAEQFDRQGVTWFEEPVSSDDRAGLAFVRERTPSAMEVAAGEYGFRIYDFQDLLDAGAADVLQVDVTRCGGITSMLAIADVIRYRHIPISTHTAPNAHLHPALAIPGVRHMEWFHDHVRIESTLFDGARSPENGELSMDPDSPGNGLKLRRGELADHRIV